MLRKLFITLSLSTISINVLAISPYAGQEQRQIKALSEKEVQGLLQGKGMGMAKAGELNQYPGPKHVIELADKLKLTQEQLQQTRDLFKVMQNEAIRVGKKIIEKEKQLDKLFSENRVNKNNLKQVLLEIGQLRAELRFVHLSTHLQQKALLNKKQVNSYVQLRGYSGSHHDHGAHHEHH